jgi:putative transposase
MKRRRAVLAKVRWRVANIRRDALHKATTAISKNFETITLEDLNVAGMVKNHHLAGAVSDAAFGEIRRQFEYKQRNLGGHVRMADRWFASSKTCFDCKMVNAKVVLGVGTWTCDGCGAVLDRDENAANNLEYYELVGQALSEPSLDDPVATSGEIAALAVPYGTVKLRSLNRELNQCAHVLTH